MEEERMKQLIPLSGEVSGSADDDNKMTEHQNMIANKLLNGPRGKIEGPFNTWLRCPELCDRLQKVGEYVRFNSSLPRRLSELAIILTARHWTAQYEWHVHSELARQAGITNDIIDAIARGDVPEFLNDDEKTVWIFCSELNATKSLSDETYRLIINTFGEEGLVELIGTVGYYGIVSMTLNIARVPLPSPDIPLLPS